VKLEQLKSLRLGDRVSTELGDGTIVAFETIDMKNAVILLESSFKDRYTRIVVALDDDTKWRHHSPLQRHPFLISHSILKII